jgi:translation elongation factor EF-Tu-like GTPase
VDAEAGHVPRASIMRSARRGRVLLRPGTIRTQEHFLGFWVPVWVRSDVLGGAHSPVLHGSVPESWMHHMLCGCGMCVFCCVLGSQRG